VSHSHDDNPIARDLAERLRANGVGAWFDEWEIKPGDSLVQKIFEEGLKDVVLFVVLLSPASVRSKWVREELDAAIVQRLEGATRVVPVVVEPCEIPVALRHLLRLDLQATGIDEVIARLIDVAFDRDTRPPLGAAPRGLKATVSGLSNHASRAALLLSQSLDQTDGRPRALSGQALADELDLTPDQVNETVDELASLGLVRVHRWLGTSPFAFGNVEPTAYLALHLGPTVMGYDPEDDVKTVAAAVVQKREADGSAIAEITGLPASRINRAVAYLEDYNLAKVLKAIGTGPYAFMEVDATSATLHYVREQSQSA
jgi:hypothetical protein